MARVQSILDTEPDDRSRDENRKKFSWSIPTTDNLNAIKRWLGPKIIEIGAGTGYWSKCLFDIGCEMNAWDRAPYKNEWVDGRFFEVHVSGPEVVARYKDDWGLFMCWPDHVDDTAWDALRRFQGDRFVYVGADPELTWAAAPPKPFWDLLRSEWILRRELECPRYTGVFDVVRFYARA